MGNFNNPYTVNTQSTWAGNSGGMMNTNIQGYNPMEYSNKQNRQRNNPWNNGQLGEGIAKGAEVVGGAIDGVAAGVDIFNDIQGGINEYRDQRFQSAETEINGVPVYSGVASLGAQASAIDPSQAGKGMVGSAAMKGAKGGAALGAAIGTAVPVLGNVVGGIAGTIIGGIGGAVAGLFGKDKAETEADHAKQRATDAFNKGQKDYNEDVEDYFQGVDTKRQDAQGERNYAKRLYGINQYKDPFHSILS